MCTVGYGISRSKHLKIIVHLVSYGIAVVTFSVEWAELQLLLEVVISDRWGVLLLGMFS